MSNTTPTLPAVASLFTEQADGSWTLDARPGWGVCVAPKTARFRFTPHTDRVRFVSMFTLEMAMVRIVEEALTR